MLKLWAPLFLAAVSFVGCGGPGLDAKAEQSLDRLSERERAAAQILVELEEASRDEDAVTLCRRVYVYDGSQPQCERTFEYLFDRQRTMALEIQDLSFRDGTAVAHAEVTTVGSDNNRRTDVYTFRLLRTGDSWKVEFQT